MQAKTSQKNKRRGLQKLSCHGCDAGLYITWAQAEAHGMPVCSCGEGFEPDDFELALALNMDEAACVVEYRAALTSAFRGQAGRAHKFGSDHMRSPDELAERRVVRDRKDRSRKAQLSGLLPAVNADPMPF